MDLSAKHRRTLRAIFSRPTPSSIEWARIEALLVACGCEIVEGSGSRVKFAGPEASGRRIATFHRPHPAKEAKPYQVRDARSFLAALGITPDPAGEATSPEDAPIPDARPS